MFALLKSKDLCPEGLRSRFKKGFLKYFQFLYYPGEGSARIWFSVILVFILIAEGRIIQVTEFSTSYYYSYSPDLEFTLVLTISVMLLYSFIGIIINRILKFFIKHKISDLQAAVFVNILITVFSALFGIADVNDAEYFFPFYYLFGEHDSDFIFEGTKWQEFILFLIFINLIYGIFLFIRQQKKEKNVQKHINIKSAL